MAPAPPPFLIVGHLPKAHGNKGELLLLPLTDRPDEVFRLGAEFRIGDSHGRRPEIGMPPLVIQELRPFKRGYIVAFDGIETRSEAEILTDRYLVLPFEEVPPLAENELHYHELLGSRVRTTEGVEVGEVVEVYEMHPSDLLEVRTRSGTVLIPFNRQVVVGVNREERVLEIEPPAGLLDL